MVLLAVTTAEVVGNVLVDCISAVTIFCSVAVIGGSLITVLRLWILGVLGIGAI